MAARPRLTMLLCGRLLADCNAIERDLRSRLEEKFNTAANGQAADDLAIKMVKEVYEPVVKAIDHRYSVIVRFK